MSVASSRLLCTSQSLTVLLPLALTRVRPSGENATECTVPARPVSVVISLLPCTSHSLMVLSSPALASVRPSGENATEYTLSACPVRVASSRLPSTSHSLMVLSSLALARHTIDTDELRQQVVAWEAEGLAASTINHRLSALSQLYKVLDGEDSHNPVARIRRVREPQAKPDGRSPETIQRVFTALERRVKAQNRGWRTLARLKVIALTGMRHSQVMRLEADHFYLDHDPPFALVVDPGKDGEPHAKPLTQDGVDAFRLFVQAEAWGQFSQPSVYKSWKAACEEAGVPFFNPYKLRHSVRDRAPVQGMDLADVQELMGHKSAKTTQRYAMVAPKKLAAAAELLHHAWHPGQPAEATPASASKAKTGT